MLEDLLESIWAPLPRGYSRKPQGALRSPPKKPSSRLTRAPCPLERVLQEASRSSLRGHLRPLERVLQDATEVRSRSIPRGGHEALKRLLKRLPKRL
eukprot:7427005-Pyramimonas_sp.AAC.1